MQSIAMERCRAWSKDQGLWVKLDFPCMTAIVSNKMHSEREYLEDLIFTVEAPMGYM